MNFTRALTIAILIVVIVTALLILFADKAGAEGLDPYVMAMRCTYGTIAWPITTQFPSWAAHAHVQLFSDRSDSLEVMEWPYTYYTQGTAFFYSELDGDFPNNVYAVSVKIYVDDELIAQSMTYDLPLLCQPTLWLPRVEK